MEVGTEDERRLVEDEAHVAPLAISEPESIASTVVLAEAGAICMIWRTKRVGGNEPPVPGADVMNVARSATVKPLGVLVSTVVVCWLMKVRKGLDVELAVDAALKVHPGPPTTAKQPSVLKVICSARVSACVAAKIARSMALMASGLSRLINRSMQVPLSRRQSFVEGAPRRQVEAVPAAAGAIAETR